ncbi:CYTH and CHAD domain-containing protein [Paracoccus benzoatiresistens]|uniref:CHAD domain-containing protein n=1 Tax=Paracoccus benzoatiresistens TaxID=2997341 RepID=A0ABT4J190_9RHOB|nr:CHAD domain-containing protein [Paracoccus sp. EF6]MCZ0960176.1 CHAD domain-containing protein [Paracoccus sp. EF6]
MDEIELKLQLTEAGADAILAAGVLPGQPKPVAQHAVYFDTPDHALAGAGLSLRIRKAKGRRIQTVKQAKGGAAGIFARPEWEMPVNDDRPVLDDTTPVAGVLGDRTQALAPVFTVSVIRQSWTFDEGGARIEAVIDRGEITASDRRGPVCECELELISGPQDALFAVARRLNAVAPVRLGVLTKSERGYRLIGPLPISVKAEDVALDRGMTAAQAFQRIVLSCLRQFRLNEDLLLVTRAAEPLHQARVALRRLRSAFTIFRPILGTSGAGLREELRWLAGTLGEARDLDVLLPRAPAGPLHDRLRAAREAAHDAVAEALASDRVRALMLDLAEWVGAGDWLTEPDTQGARDMEAQDFAAAALSRFRRKVKKGGRDLSHLEDEARHELRKDAKKLRYAADFFAPLFTGDRAKDRKKFGAALADFQDHLGALNDLAAAPLVLERLGLADAPGVADLTHAADRAPLLAAAEDAHDALVGAERYWT